MSNEIKKVASAVERSAKALSKTIADVAKVNAELQALASSTEILVVAVEDKEAQLANLDAEYATKLREATAELKLKVLENEDSVLESLLKKNSLAKVSTQDLAALKGDLAKAIDSNESTVDEAVRKAVAELTYKQKVELDAQKASFDVEKAQLTATAESKDIQIKLLTAQITDLQGQVAAERAARIEVAKAESGKQGVIVNTTGSR